MQICLETDLERSMIQNEVRKLVEASPIQINVQGSKVV